jgi:hypothetical protein
VFVALNPGRYNIVRRKSDKMTEAGVTLAPASVRTVTIENFKPVPSYRLTSKGEKTESPRFGVKIGASAGFADLSHLSGQINTTLAPFGQFGKAPEIKYWMVQPGAGSEVEAMAGSMVLLTLGVNYQRQTGNDEFSWTHAGPGSAATYPVTLKTRDTLRTFTVYTGPGVRFNRGLFNNFSIRAGFELKFCKFGFASQADDALMDISQSASVHDDGVMLFPFVRIGYMRPVNRHIWIAGDIGYRHQSEAREFYSFMGPVYESDYSDYGYYPGSDDSFTYKLGGFDARLFVMLAP